MTRSKLFSELLLLVCAVALLSSAQAQDVMHAIAGSVTKLDKAGKTIAIKTADGSEEAFKYSEHTAVRDSRATAHIAQMGAVESYFAGKEGTRVVVRYTGQGADKTAALVEDFGKDTLKAGRGTVTHFDRAAHTVAIKTDNGAEETYHLGSDAVVDTDHGVVRGTRYVAKEGDKVVVHYTEKEGSKVVHLFKKL